MVQEKNQVITCSSLTKKYGRKSVLNGVDLAVPAGEIFALLGTNGTGKTTLIRTMLGLIPRSGGQISILGEDPWQSGHRLRTRVGYVSEEQGLYEWMTVRQLIDFCKGLYQRWNQPLVNEYLQRFGLSTTIKIKTMSKGQKVRLALILALAFDPELLILDEPMSGLDPLAQHEFLQIIQNDATQNGKTIFFSTHNLPDVEAIATYVAILNEGIVKAVGPIQDVIASIRRVRVPQSNSSPSIFPNAYFLESNGKTAAYLIPTSTESWNEISSAGIGSELLENSPASLQEVFLYYCSRRDSDAGQTSAL